MMVSFIKRHSALCTALSLLLAAFAAPYLVPENPDSLVFRSGVLGLLLLGVCVFPLKNALDRHPVRALHYGAVLALCFAISLSLGAELRQYGALLPGMGSLVRRLAVPCMIAPLLSGLFSYLFVIRSHAGAQPARQIPYAAFFGLFVCCYGAVMLALYPGVISYDFQHEIQQYTEGVYHAAHPVFHTLFLGTIYRLGETLFGTMTAGAALYSAVQLLLLAALYAWACVFVQRRVSKRSVVFALAACFAFLPFHGVLAVSTAKDPLFSGLCVSLCLLLWEIAEDPAAFLASRARIVRFCACCLGMALLRHNGVFAYIPALAALLILAGPLRRKALVAAVAALALTVMIPKGLEFCVGAHKTPSSEMMSVPCQQLMRTANLGNLPENEFEQIERWFPAATHTYRPHCADPAKGGNFNFLRYQNDPYDFWSTYAKYGLKYPRLYIEAFLENSVGLWYIDDTSHAHSLSSEEAEYIYLNTVYPFEPNEYPIESESKFPALQKLLYASMHDAKHQSVPFLSQLFCPAVYSFLLLFITLRLCCAGQKGLALCTLPVWGIIASLLFSAGIFIRYAYPVMATVPVLLALACFSDSTT